MTIDRGRMWAVGGGDLLNDADRGRALKQLRRAAIRPDNPAYEPRGPRQRCSRSFPTPLRLRNPYHYEAM